MDLECAVSYFGVACYVAASLLAVASLFGARPRGERAALTFLAVGGAVLAGVLIVRGTRALSLPVFNRFDALTCYVLALSGAYLLLMAHRYLRGIAGLLIPYATVVLLAGGAAIGMEQAAKNE